MGEHSAEVASMGSLYRAGLIGSFYESNEYEGLNWGRTGKLVDYAKLYCNRAHVLRRAFPFIKEEILWQVFR